MGIGGNAAGGIGGSGGGATGGNSTSSLAPGSLNKARPQSHRQACPLGQEMWPLRCKRVEETEKTPKLKSKASLKHFIADQDAKTGPGLEIKRMTGAGCNSAKIQMILNAARPLEMVSQRAAHLSCKHSLCAHLMPAVLQAS